MLDVIVKLRRDAAETLAAAEAINESTLAALLAGAVPVEAAREVP